MSQPYRGNATSPRVISAARTALPDPQVGSSIMEVDIDMMEVACVNFSAEFISVCEGIYQ